MSTHSAKTAVISGGSSGIGRAFVASLHADGWQVCTCGRDAAKLAALERDFPGVFTMVCDVADRTAVRRFAQQVESRAASIDLLISNAGGLREINFATANLAMLDLSGELRGNLEGAVNLIAEFLPGLRAQAGGRLLVVSSGYALAPTLRAPLYSAAKAALHSLCLSLRGQLAPIGITVTELLPPVVDTPAVAHRSVRKLSADAVAQAALRGSFAGVAEVRPGIVRVLPLLLRLMPALALRLVARS